jgi:alanine dehydrogenase
LKTVLTDKDVMTEPIWISESEVVELMHLGEAIGALEKGLLMEARGEAQNMIKTHVAWGRNNLHAIGASFVGAGVVGTKTWAHTEGGTCPLLLLFDAQNGSLKAIIEAFAMGQMRTAGVSGVATDWLADPGADVMALIGTGKQSLTQVAAVAAVRPLKRLNVFSPRAESRAAFVEKARQEFGFEVVDASSVEEAVSGAGVVTLVTRAAEPFLTAGMLAKGAHVNAVGAITSDREEFSQDLFARCGQISVDSLPSVQKLSREFMAQFGDSQERWQQVQPLSQLLAAGKRRSPSSDITLFKAMGMGISDLSLGMEIYRRALERGVGRAMPQPKKIKPRLSAGKA